MIALRPSGVSTNAAFTASAAAMAIPGNGTYVRVANVSTNLVATDVYPILYVQFGTDKTAQGTQGVAVTLTADNGLGIPSGTVAYLLRPENATNLWHIGSATGRLSVSTGEMA